MAQAKIILEAQDRAVVKKNKLIRDAEYSDEPYKTELKTEVDHLVYAIKLLDYEYKPIEEKIGSVNRNIQQLLGEKRELESKIN